MADSGTFEASDLAVLHRVARVLLREREYGELLADLLESAMEGFGADRGFVVVREGEAYRAAASRNYKSEALAEAEQEISSSIARYVSESGSALLLGDALDSQFSENPSVKRMSLRSILSAPLVASGEVFALLYLENRDIAHRFEERHRTLLEEICRMAAPRLRSAVALEQSRRLTEQLEATAGADGILTADAAMTRLLATLRQVATTELPVLIEGETGTGKELLARAVYRHSRRARGPFVVVNCAAIPGGLIESELFGYMRGAFTGATRDHAGLVAAAHHGTLFLDEIGELPLELQPRLLRVLQSGEFTRLGSTRAETADLRFVAATNRNLLREVEEGRFRSDLYYRLSAVTLKAPPLRERQQDIRLLGAHFLRAAAMRYARPVPALTEKCWAALEQYLFPGNVRELESEMARLVAVAPPGEPVGPESLQECFRAASRGAAVRKESAADSGDSVPPMSLEEMERRLIQSVLRHTQGNRTRAAEVLGISREGLRTKMQRLGISDS